MVYGINFLNIESPFYKKRKQLINELAQFLKRENALVIIVKAFYGNNFNFARNEAKYLLQDNELPPLRTRYALKKG
ncbi:MAG TPA: hypothetical protein DCW60_00400, partial [Sutterella sp.]|nr:hypothetical protein [Sutterella sp.]